MFDTALKILKKINIHGFDAFIVGGAVRDKIMGKDPHDIDIATNMPIDIIEKEFKTFDIGKSKDFGIVVVLIDGLSFEVAQFRKDLEYEDGRRPDGIEITSFFEEDVKRRDFTINGLGIAYNGEIMDFVGGREDIENSVLRTIGDPFERFEEDFLRMMRAPRFASRGFEIEENTRNAIKELSININDIVVERIWDEIFKAASQKGEIFAKFIELMDELDLLKRVLPEVWMMKFFDHPPTYHPEGGVFDHTLAALRVNEIVDPVVNIAILLHDVGKIETFKINRGKPSYHGHDKKSGEIIRRIAKRFKISKSIEESLIFAAENHMKFHKILEMKPSKIAKLVSDSNWNILVEVGRADEFSRGETFKYAGEFEKIVLKAKEIQTNFQIKQDSKPLKLVNGKHVMDLTGFKPGPIIGKIIKETSNWILDNEINNEKLIDEKIVSFV